MPSLGMMPINSLAAADSVIIPSQPSFLSAKGLDLLMQSISIEAIPMGQPLLVDHHSYKSDKNYRDRTWGKMEKSFEAGKKADYYRSKAEAAENNSAVSSDDPEAVTKLKEKLQQRQDLQSHMKKVNAYTTAKTAQ